jgi:hypothetical protein
LKGIKLWRGATPRTLESEIWFRGFGRSKPLRGPEETLKAERTEHGKLRDERGLPNPVSVEGDKA